MNKISIKLKLSLILVSAAVFFLAACPFRRFFSMIPGITEIRPANMLAPVLGMIFGIYGAVGTVIGNLVSDLATGSSMAACLSGIPIILFQSYAPYILWHSFSEKKEPPVLHSVKDILRYILIIFAVSSVVTVMLSLLAVYLNGSSFGESLIMIFFNNFDFAVLLGVPFLFFIGKRKMLYIIPDDSPSPRGLFPKSRVYVTEKSHDTLQSRFMLFFLSSEAVYIIFTAFYTYEMCAEMSFYDRWDNILTITGIFSHIVFISSLVFLRYTEKELLMPIEELARASEDFALQCRSNEQITAAPLPICGSGEVALLERTFNFMMKEIVGFMHDLKVSTAEKEYLKAELNIAARIQSGSVPESRAVFSEGSKAEFYAYMKTAKEVGGDTCDFFMTDSSHAALLIADASGKGISAAMFISAGRQMIKSAVIGGRSPSSVLAEVNRQLYEENSADMFITAWLGILDISTGRLVYANAAHNPPVLIQDGKCRYLESPPHIFLAGVKNTAYTEECIYLKEADSLILYTDGIVEALNENEELYGDERLIGALYNADTESPRSICDDILESTAEFCGKAEQADDMTMLIVKRDFSDSITVDANTENIRAIIGFAEDSLNKMKCPPSKITCFCIALDEIAANICLYAYPEGSSGAVKEPLIKGEAIVSDARKSVTESVVKRFEQRFINIKCGHSSTDKKYTMVISDNGIPFNPLSAPKADTTAALCERAAGGLGIHIVRNLMDEVSYKYEKGRNILTVSLND